MNITQKVALSSAIGGAVCAGVALLLSPTLWWIGMFAGFAAGYLAYEFKDAFVIVHRFLQRLPPWISWEMRDLRQKVVATFKKPHPFFYTGWILGFLASIPFIILPLITSNAYDKEMVFRLTMLSLMIIF